MQSAALDAFFVSQIGPAEALDYDIESLLITPFQRVVRYELLLKALLEAYEDDDAHAAALAAAVENVCAVNQRLNKKKDDAEVRENVLRVSRSVGNTGGLCIFQANRVLVREGVVMELNIQRGGSATAFEVSDTGPVKLPSSLKHVGAKQRYLYLFNDLLIIAKPIGELKSRCRVF